MAFAVVATCVVGLLIVKLGLHVPPVYDCSGRGAFTMRHYRIYRDGLPYGARTNAYVQFVKSELEKCGWSGDPAEEIKHAKDWPDGEKDIFPSFANDQK